jgi:hypothetical protein
VKVDWEKLRRAIPPKVHLGRGIHYEVCWLDKNDERDLLGETRFDVRQIVIRLEMSAKDTVVTYLHELAHAVSGEYELNLTETQILKLEAAFYYILKSSNVFKESR